MNDSVKSAVRVLDCLEVISSVGDGVSLGELTRLIGAPKSSVLALLRTLVSRAYVIRNAHDRYVINPALHTHELGWIGGPMAVLVRMAFPVLRDLTQAVRETSMLATLTSDHQLRLIDKHVSPRDIRYDTELSKLHVAHKTAGGRVQLAYLSEDELGQYVRRWSATSVPERLRLNRVDFASDLDRVRADGVALLIDEWVAGATGVSAPIFDASERVVAAVTVGAVTARFLSDREDIIEAVRRAGAEVSQRLASSLIRVSGAPHAAQPADIPDFKGGERNALSRQA